MTMGVGYRWFGRPLLRFQDSEKAHGRSLTLLRLFPPNPVTRTVLKLLYKPRRSLPVELFGHTYAHPFGLAAAWTRTPKALRGWEATGLAFVEIGGVTMLANGKSQTENVQSAKGSGACQSNGFQQQWKREDSSALKHHFDRYGRPSVPLWVNLGKSKITPLTAPMDYATTMESGLTEMYLSSTSHPTHPTSVNFRVMRGSSPSILACHEVNTTQSTTQTDKKPILSQGAPDMTAEQLVHIAQTAKSNGADGIVVSNTTVERPDATHCDAAVFAEQGGMSGQPLKERSTSMIKTVRKAKTVQIGPSSVWVASLRQMTHGKKCRWCDLIQAYSGFVFEGPALTKHYRERLQAASSIPFTSLDECVACLRGIKRIVKGAWGGRIMWARRLGFLLLVPY